MRPQNYLNNKDILKEIHKSKNSYCAYLSTDVADYDFIVQDISEIPASLQPTSELIVSPDGIEKNVVLPAAAKAARAKRLTTAAIDNALLSGVKLKSDETGINVDDIKDTDVVFRVYTWDHIPTVDVEPKQVKDKKNKCAVFEQDAEDLIVTEYDEDLPDLEPPTATVKHVKLNFRPFVHYKLTDTGELTLVGRSHWKGPLDAGEFCCTHGQLTNKLAMMFIKLCERYSTRSNWRGYTYREEMQAQAILHLTYIGLQFDESKSANPFAYYTAAITNSFTRVLNIEKKNQNIRDDILEMHNLNPSFTRQYAGHSDSGYGADE